MGVKQTYEAKIKWFNSFKGFGFVEVEEFSDDVFLHFSVLDKSKIENVNKDDIILCTINEFERGYQVSEIIEIIHCNKYSINAPQVQKNVTVKWFNSIKGFGFASLESGDDVFIHSNLLKKYKITELTQGQKLVLIVHETNFGYEALDIILPEE